MTQRMLGIHGDQNQIRFCDIFMTEILQKFLMGCAADGRIDDYHIVFELASFKDLPKEWI